MFKITPVQNQTLAKKYASICQVDLKDGAFIYAMTDIQSGDIMGISQFEIFGEYGYIYNLSSAPTIDDFEAMFILGRQTMNFIDLCGAHICRASANIEKKLLLAIGFKPDSDSYSCDMSGMFDGSHCSGHK